MRVINVITIKDGDIKNIDSFGVYEEQFIDDVVAEAENCFASRIKKIDDYIQDDDIESYIEDGYYKDDGCSVYIIWSDI